LLAVDGVSFENVTHDFAISVLKQSNLTLTIELVSWLGTEL